MIQGQHFLGPDKEQVYVGHPFKEEAYLAEYARLSIEGIESGDYLYLAHPDLPHFLGDDKTYRKYMLPVCEALKKENKPGRNQYTGTCGSETLSGGPLLETGKRSGVKAILGVDPFTGAALNLGRNQTRRAVGRKVRYQAAGENAGTGVEGGENGTDFNRSIVRGSHSCNPGIMFLP